jgi:hypothetical protein
MLLEDGTGRGYKQAVDASNRAKAFSITRRVDQESTQRGDSFNINSGAVANAVATEQAILYLKNNETRDLNITGVVSIVGASTNGTENRIKIYKNPTSLSETNAADTNSNRNFGSSLTLDVDAYKGDGSTTVTGGTVHIESIQAPLSRVFFAIDEVLTKGDSIAISHTITGNDSSTNCMAAIVCHLADANE